MRKGNKALVAALVSAIMVAGQGVYANPNNGNGVKSEEIAKVVEANNNALAGDLKSVKGPQEEVAKTPVNNLKIDKGPHVEIKNFGTEIKGNFDENSKGLSTGAKTAIGVSVGVPVAGAIGYGICKAADFAIEKWKKYKIALKNEQDAFLSSIEVDRGWGNMINFQKLRLDGWMRVKSTSKGYYICFIKVSGQYERNVYVLTTDNYNTAFAWNKLLKPYLVSAAGGLFSKICLGKPGQPLFENVYGLANLQSVGFINELIGNNNNLECTRCGIVGKIFNEYSGYQKYFSLEYGEFEKLGLSENVEVIDSGECLD